MPVCVGSTSVNLYPVVDDTMQTHERVHAFQINKAALALQNITPRLQLDALGNQRNLLATVNGVVHDWLQYFQDNWYNCNCLTILSFHNVKGNVILDTTPVGNSTVLLPVLNGNAILSTIVRKTSSLSPFNFV